MEGGRLAMAFAIYLIVVLTFATNNVAAAGEDAGGIAPSPQMENAGMALSTSAGVAALVSLVAWLF